jgi:hypothetical protein
MTFHLHMVIEMSLINDISTTRLCLIKWFIILWHTVLYAGSTVRSWAIKSKISEAYHALNYNNKNHIH